MHKQNLLKEMMDAEAKKGNYVIVGGDFNQTVNSIDLEKYKIIDPLGWAPGVLDADEFEKDGWQMAFDDSTPTCRTLRVKYEGADKTNFQYYLIDGFIVSSNIKINSLQTISKDFVYSDHNPIYMTSVLE